MLSKNNQSLMKQKQAPQHQRFGLRKLTIGVASVLLGTTFMMGTAMADQLNTTSTDANETQTTALSTSQSQSTDQSQQQSDHQVEQPKNESQTDQSGTDSQNDKATDNQQQTLVIGSHNSTPISAQELGAEEREESTPIFSGTTNWSPNGGKSWDGKTADVTYSAQNNDTSTITYKIQSWDGKYVSGSLNYQGQSKYLVMIPAGFETDALTPISTNAALNYQSKDLGFIGPHGEQTFLVTLAQTPSFSNPFSLKANLKINDEAGGLYSYNQWSPLLVALSDNMNADSAAYGGGSGSITGTDGTKYNYVWGARSFNDQQFVSNIAYTVIPGKQQLANSNYKVTQSGVHAVATNVTGTGNSGYEELDTQFKITGTVHDGDYIDFRLGIPYQDKNGHTTYELYDSTLSSKKIKIANVGTVFNLGNYYRLVFNNESGVLENPDISLQLRWGSGNNTASVNAGKSYVYQVTSDPTKDHTTFQYTPQNDVDINGQKFNSGLKVTGTYIYTAKPIGISNRTSSASSGPQNVRTWNQRGDVIVRTKWFDNLNATLSTKDLGNDFDIRVQLNKDTSGLIKEEFTSADDMKKQIEDDIAADTQQKLLDAVVGDNDSFVTNKATDGTKPKVKVEVTRTITTSPTDPEVQTAIWHVKLSHEDPSDNTPIALKQYVTTVVVSADNFTMPSDITSYDQDHAQIVAVNHYNGAKTSNANLLKALENLPEALTRFDTHHSDGTVTSSPVWGGPWTAAIEYKGNSDIDGGGSATDLVTNTLSFEDSTTHRKVSSDITFQGATGTTIKFVGAQAAYNGISGYQFDKAVSVKNGHETELASFDPTKIDSYNFGTANKNGASSYIIYVKKASTAVQQKATLQFVDDDNNGIALTKGVIDNDTDSTPINVTAEGNHGTAITFANVATIVNKLEQKHYVLSETTDDTSNATSALFTILAKTAGRKIGGSTDTDWSTLFGDFDNDSAVNQLFTIHFKHGTEDASRQKTIKETVHYVMSDGTTAPSDNVQSLKFTEDGTTDLVTGDTTYTPAADQSFAKVDSPSVAGYTPDLSSVPSQTVNYDSDDITKTVTYSPDAQKLSVKFIDDTTGDTLKTVKKAGVSNGDAKYTTKNDIDSYETQHYILVSDSTGGKDLKFDNDDSTDQAYEVHLKHDTKNVSRQKTIKETVHYVMSDGTTAPSDNVQSLKFTEDGTTDLVTGDTTYTPAADQSFAKVDSPKVKGYTPDIALIPSQSVNFDSSDITKTVTYTPDAQKLSVKFIDDTTGKTLKTVDKTGVSNSDAKYNTKADITNYEGQHYLLVSDSTNGQDLKFDDNDTVDQTYEVHLKHATQPASRQKTVTETITYVMSDGSKAPDKYVANLNFTENGTKDLVTGKVTYTPAASQIFAKVDSPRVTGYTPDIASIPSQSVNYDSDNIIKKVTYTPDAQKLSVKFIDDATGKTLKTVDKSGASNGDAKYNTKADIDGYEGQHYLLVSDSTNGQDLKFDDNDAVDQTYEVHLKHATQPASRKKTITETVHYVMSDGTTAPRDNVQSLKFTEDGITDLVTGIITYTPAASQTFVKVDSPVVTGYTPDIASIPSQSVNFDSSDITKTVTYTPDVQKLSVKFIDDTTGKTLKTVTKTGVSNGDAKYNTKNDIDNYEGQHYVLVSDSTNGQNLKFDNNDAVDQTYEVHLKHDTQPASRQKTVTETINYVMSDGSKAPDKHVASLNFTESGTKDLVTGKIIYSPAADQTFAKVDSPVVAGYTPDIASVPSQTVNFDSDDITKTVTYTPDAQKLSVKFIDDTTGKTLKTVDKIGVSNGDAKYNTKADIDGYEGQHYLLVSDSTNGQELFFDNNDAVDQTYEVHLKHATQNVSRNKTITETVHYVMDDGTQAPADHEQILHFTETGTTDLVTGHTDWNPAVLQTFAAVPSPVVTGYTPDRAVIAPVTVGFDDSDLVMTVHYHTNPQSVNPTTPAQPSQPQTPGQPTKPTTPAQPSQPQTPSQPTRPTTPVQPGETQKPGHPVSLVTPAQPGQPKAAPKTLAKSNNGAPAEQPTKAESRQLPQTGNDHDSAAVAGFGLLAILGLLGLGKRRKHN